MTAWEVGGIFAAIVVFGITVGTPISRLVSAITRLDTTMALFRKEYDCNKKTNEEEHVAIWDRLDNDDAKLGDHETRLTVIEHEKKVV